MRDVIVIGLVLGGVLGAGCEYQRIDANDRNALSQRRLVETPLLDDIEVEKDPGNRAEEPGSEKEAEITQMVEEEEMEEPVGCMEAEEEDITRLKQEIAERTAGIRELGGSVPEPARHRNDSTTCEDDIEVLEEQLASIRRAYGKAKELASSQDQARAQEPPVEVQPAEASEGGSACNDEEEVARRVTKQEIFTLLEQIRARGGQPKEPEIESDGTPTCAEEVQFLKEWLVALRVQQLEEQGVVVPANEAEARPAASLSAVWHDSGALRDFSRGLRNDNDLRGAMPDIDASVPRHQFYPRGSL